MRHARQQGKRCLTRIEHISRVYWLYDEDTDVLEHRSTLQEVALLDATAADARRPAKCKASESNYLSQTTRSRLNGLAFAKATNNRIPYTAVYLGELTSSYI